MRLTLAAALLLAVSSCRDVTLPEPAASQPGTVQLLVVYAKPGQTALSPAVGARARIVGSGAEVVADNAEARLTLGGVSRDDAVVHVTFDANDDGKIDHQKLIGLRGTGAGPGRDVFLGVVVVGRNAEIVGRVLKGDRVSSAGGHGGVAMFVPEAPFATVSADDGSFRLGGLPEGDLSVAAFAAGYTSFAQAVTLRSGEELKLADIVLESAPGGPQVGDLDGSAFLVDGSPAAGVTVTALGGAGPRSTMTTGEGAWSLAGVDLGLWRLRFERQGLRTLELANILVAPGKNHVTPVTLVPEGEGGGAGGGGEAGGGAAGGATAGGGGVTGPITVGFRILNDGGAHGFLTWADGGHVCPGADSCTEVMNAGDRITFRGIPDEPWARLIGWSEACHGAPSGSCDVDMTPGLELQVGFDRPNLVFVTSAQRVPGTIAADGEPFDVLKQLCRELAVDAGLPGDFVPWVHYQPLDGGLIYDPLDSVVGARGWVRPDGLPVFDQLTPATLDQPLYLPMLTEHLQLVPSSTRVAIGSYFGNFNGAFGTCNAFSVTNGGLYFGAPRFGGARWLTYDINSTVGNCSAFHRFYCFGRDKSLPVAPEPGPVRHAFVTVLPVSIDVDAGVAAFDTRCNADAVSLGFDGGFRALVPISGLPAWTRVGMTGPPWARRDGVIVATPADLMLTTPSMRAPMQNGPGRSVWFGAQGPGSTGSQPCGNWSSTQPADNVGHDLATGPEWANYGPAACFSPDMRVYCFEQ